MSCSASVDCFLADKIGMIKRNLAVTVTISGNHLNCAGARVSAASVENLCVRFFLRDQLLFLKLAGLSELGEELKNSEQNGVFCEANGRI